MNCEEVRLKFVDFIDGDLSEEERLSVELHTARCYPCREELDDLAKVLQLCTEVLRHPCPTNRFRELRDRLTADEPVVRTMTIPRRQPRLHDIMRRLAIAAVIIGAVSVLPFLATSLERFFSMPDSKAIMNGTGFEEIQFPFLARFIQQKRRTEQELLRTLGTVSEQASDAPIPTYPNTFTRNQPSDYSITGRPGTGGFGADSSRLPGGTGGP